MKKLILLSIFIGFIFSNSLCQDTLILDGGNRNLAIELTNKAITNLEKKKPVIAYNLLLKAIEADKTHRGSYVQLYQVGITNQVDLDEIIKLIDGAKSLFKEDDELYYYVGDMYRMKYNYKKAISEYSMAIKLSKTNGEDFFLVPFYYFNRANCYLKTSEYQKAINDYNYTLKLNPYFYACLSNKGITLYQMGKKEEACKCWREGFENGQKASKKYFDKYCEY